jgi:hypothetical protein
MLHALVVSTEQDHPAIGEPACCLVSHAGSKVGWAFVCVPHTQVAGAYEDSVPCRYLAPLQLKSPLNVVERYDVVARKYGNFAIGRNIDEHAPGDDGWDRACVRGAWTEVTQIIDCASAAVPVVVGTLRHVRECIYMGA